ncbi:MAG: PAS domain-containing protein, partial [Thermoleophilia bacterium]
MDNDGAQQIHHRETGPVPLAWGGSIGAARGPHLTIAGTISINSAGLITAFDPGAEDLLEHRADDVLGRPMAELLIPEPFAPGARGRHGAVPANAGALPHRAHRRDHRSP